VLHGEHERLCCRRVPMAGIGSGDGVVIVGGSTGEGSAAASSADVLILRAAAASRMAPFFTRNERPAGEQRSSPSLLITKKNENIN